MLLVTSGSHTLVSSLIRYTRYLKKIPLWPFYGLLVSGKSINRLQLAISIGHVPNRTQGLCALRSVAFTMRVFFLLSRCTRGAKAKQSEAKDEAKRKVTHAEGIPTGRARDVTISWSAEFASAQEHLRFPLQEARLCPCSEQVSWWSVVMAWRSAGLREAWKAGAVARSEETSKPGSAARRSESNWSKQKWILVSIAGWLVIKTDAVVLCCVLFLYSMFWILPSGKNCCAMKPVRDLNSRTLHTEGV